MNPSWVWRASRQASLPLPETPRGLLTAVKFHKILYFACAVRKKVAQRSIIGGITTLKIQTPLALDIEPVLWPNGARTLSFSFRVASFWKMCSSKHSLLFFMETAAKWQHEDVKFKAQSENSLVVPRTEDSWSQILRHMRKSQCPIIEWTPSYLFRLDN